MESPANPNGNPNPNIAGQDPGEPQLDKTDSVGILKQQLIKIAKDKHERLIKDVEGILQCKSFLFCYSAAGKTVRESLLCPTIIDTRDLIYRFSVHLRNEFGLDIHH